MVNKVRDFTGFKIGKLTGIGSFNDLDSKRVWIMECECGMVTYKKPKQLFDYINKKMNPMCDLCKLNTFKHKEKSKLYKYMTEK